MSSEINDFYVTLSSNVDSADDNNSIANFVTHLPAPLSLDSSWRVGLTEIHYTNSWLNLREDSILIVRKVFTDVPSDEELNHRTVLPAGRYQNIKTMIGIINNLVAFSLKTEPALPEIPFVPSWPKPDQPQKAPKFYSNEMTHRVNHVNGYTDKGQPTYIECGHELMQMLGIHEGYTDLTTIITLGENEKLDSDAMTLTQGGNHVARHPYDMTGGIHSLFVYCDVADYSIVGDTKAQLLRIAHIPAESVFGSAAIDRFENPQYLPLATKDINSIEVHIKDDVDETIPFAFGRVKLVLHFIKNG